MPCCGGKDAGKPITRSRYFFGLFMILGTHCAIFLALVLVSLVFPRYRKLLRAYYEYSLKVFRSVFQKERIVIGHADPDQCPTSNA
jgi:hypothetical protein